MVRPFVNPAALAPSAEREYAERAYAKGLEAIRTARRLGLPARLQLRQALDRARGDLVNCSEQRADAIRALFRSHALRGKP